MNTSEACTILGILPGASPEDVKKAFRKKAGECHPDKNPNDPNAESNFKKINEAYQYLEKHGSGPLPGPNDVHNVSSNTYSHQDDLADEVRRRMEDLFGKKAPFNPLDPFGHGIPFNPFDAPFGAPRTSRSEPIIFSVEIPFDVSVIGGKVDVSFERKVKCEHGCDDGNVQVNKVMCQKCGGHGKRKYGAVRRVDEAGEDKELPCTSCKGTGYVANTGVFTPCSYCSGTGSKKSVETLRVIVPPGVENGSRLILEGKGNYNHGQYDNVIVVIRVLPDHDMHLNGKDVISVIELTLLEALQGTKKKLRTIRGEKTLAIKPKTRHRDTIRVSGFGVPPNGSHEFVINVNYPDDVSDLIKVLQNKVEPEPEEISGVQN